jgi:hypothetical protein
MTMMLCFTSFTGITALKPMSLGHFNTDFIKINSTSSLTSSPSISSSLFGHSLHLYRHNTLRHFRPFTSAFRAISNCTAARAEKRKKSSIVLLPQHTAALLPATALNSTPILPVYFLPILEFQQTPPTLNGTVLSVWVTPSTLLYVLHPTPIFDLPPTPTVEPAYISSRCPCTSHVAHFGVTLVMAMVHLVVMEPIKLGTQGNLA